mmetsp:Transcript_16438/g.33164  ORF Transcript_16438/g.33164 Transcript_16438/m.33164 type:complete len:174 (-) Transcript_16438:212-733(-)
MVSSDPLPFRSELVSHLSPQDEICERRKNLIKQTWRSVEFGLGQKATEVFYDRLFTNYPDTQPLFAHVSMQGQSQKLYGVLRLAVRSLNDLDAIIPTVQELGRRHSRSYGVMRDHYGAVTQTFIEILHEYILTQWGTMAHTRYLVDVADAWAWYLNLIGGIMADAADEAGLAR